MATISGGAIGLLFNNVDESDFLILSKICLTAFTYSFALFSIFSIFTIITKNRLVNNNKYFK